MKKSIVRGFRRYDINAYFYGRMMKKRLFLFALWLFGKFMTLYGNTFRYRATGKEKLDELFRSGKSVVFFTWHNQIFPILHYNRGVNLAIIISSSKDGDIMAHVAESFGYRAVRGSSSRNGSKALLEIKKLMNGSWHAAIAVDGPKGPKYKMKPGALFLAKNTHGIMMPVIFDCTSFKRFASWDGFILPYPFARIDVHYCDPVYVSDSADPETIKKEAEEIEKSTMEQTLVHSPHIV